MSPLLGKAEEILDIAAMSGDAMSESAIVIDRSGGFRMVDPAGWTLHGLASEYGAAAVFRIARLSDSVRVEGWDGRDRCLLQRPRRFDYRGRRVDLVNPVS